MKLISSFLRNRKFLLSVRSDYDVIGCISLFVTIGLVRLMSLL